MNSTQPKCLYIFAIPHLSELMCSTYAHIMLLVRLQQFLHARTHAHTPVPPPPFKSAKQQMSAHVFHKRCLGMYLVLERSGMNRRLRDIKLGENQWETQWPLCKWRNIFRSNSSFYFIASPEIMSSGWEKKNVLFYIKFSLWVSGNTFCKGRNVLFTFSPSHEFFLFLFFLLSRLIFKLFKFFLLLILSFTALVSFMALLLKIQ